VIADAAFELRLHCGAIPEVNPRILAERAQGSRPAQATGPESSTFPVPAKIDLLTMHLESRGFYLFSSLQSRGRGIV
jgi:hypothetical protein